MSSNNRPGLAFIAKSLKMPCSYIIVPAAAIIAALSPHKDSGGIINVISGSSDATCSVNRSLNPRLAATLLLEVIASHRTLLQPESFSLQVHLQRLLENLLLNLPRLAPSLFAGGCVQC